MLRTVNGAGSGARTRDLRMSQTPQGACTSYDCLGGCPMSPTRYQLRHPGLNRGLAIPSLNKSDKLHRFSDELKSEKSTVVF